MTTETSLASAHPRAVAPPSDTAPGRLVSLDAFRGLTIAGMVLVNNPGSWAHTYAPLKHAEWHGFTPTDLIFPSFLFIVGTAIPLALGKRLRRGDSTAQVVTKVVWRSLIIIGLGLLMAAFPYVGRDLSTLRFPGVLQRIGLCYLAASLVYLSTSSRSQVALILAILLGYWAAMTHVPVPGVGPGDLSRSNNLAAWLDRLVLAGHTYKPDYDPEGLLSTLPAIATTLLGVLTGRWLSATHRGMAEKVAGLFAAGAVLTFAGSVWGAYFPINKPIWTSSYVLYAGGLSLTLLGLCAWLIEVEGRRRWAWPFVAFGSNAILVFVLSGLLVRVLLLVKVAGPDGKPVALWGQIYRVGYAPWFPPEVASLLFAVTYVLLWFLVAAVLHRFRIFVRV